jgi:hypothetical protein
LQNQISTGATLLGGVALQPAVAGALDDVATLCGVALHSGYWATVLLAIVGAWLHRRENLPEK